MMRNKLFWLLYLVPKNLLSFWVGYLVHLRLPQPLARKAVSRFAARYKLNMQEAEFPLEHYQTIGTLFTRKLKPGARPVDAKAEFVHPADGVMTLRGYVYQSELVQAKGKKYHLADFLKATTEDLKPFEGGVSLTYYLCPTDYHRVHSPVSGQIIACTHVPGRLWPVNPWSVTHISQLFAVNERVVVWIQSGRHKIAVVFVGATNVGKMTMSFDPLIVTNQRRWRTVLHKKYRSALPIQKGQELGVFNMGSTVIVVTPRGFFEDQPESGPYPTRCGEALPMRPLG